MREIEKDTIVMAAGGNIAAFEEIYKQCSSTVYTLAFGVTRNCQDAEEATQDVFVKVFRSLRNFRFGSSFNTWLYRIAMNTAINIYRKRARQGAVSLQYDDLKDTRQETPDMRQNEIRQGDVAARIAALLDNISPEHRSCIMLREIEGFDYKEMAGILKIPLNTVRSRLKRAREALIAYCRKEGIRYEL
ncbi:MAG: sigma-70 family RNA polymerase sigma factor [Candidatus Omnitrophica bacterium]|nr:sigma-70 family RNA polymerase sigma factor [Candidatus Omnitrophota bacterium]